MRIDFKVSVWESVNIPKEIEEEVKKAMKLGNIETQEDLIEFIELKNYGDKIETKTMFETKEYLTPQDNDNQATVELYENDRDRDPSITNND